MRVQIAVLVLLGASLGSVGLAAARPARKPIEAVFERRSYAPGEVAGLTFWSRPAAVHVQIFRAGPAGPGAARKGLLNGAAVTGFVPAPAGSRVAVPVGNWPCGLYFARLTGSGRVGFAVFVVRPRRLGEHRVAVVLPTNTWQAYNFRDVDGDGVGDTWYADRSIASVDMSRPFLDAGVPPHYRQYDRGFIHWLALHEKHVDVLSDDDLDRVASGDALAQRYDLVIFSGHEEYVTTREYNVVRRYRDVGGNLAFLSANNFFVRVERRGVHLFHRGRWRDLGRPEASLVGVQYLDWNEDRWPNVPYLVTGAQNARWLFRATGLKNGSRFGTYGIEVDARTSASPAGVRVLARLPDIFGPGRSGEMTYYTTPQGAKVFAAGSMNFGGSALWPLTSKLLANLWAELARP